MFMANMQASGGALMADEISTGSMMSYTFEQLEIACYRSRIGAAEEFGDSETTRVCTEILHRKEAMAEWLDQRLPEPTREFVRRERAGQSAKR
jgi:ferritin-like metal-binding protein YciE